MKPIHQTRLLRLAALWVALAAGGCIDGSIEAASGSEAKLRVLAAQYQPGDFPVDVTSDAGAPAPAPLPDGGSIEPPRIVTLDVLSTRVPRGSSERSLRMIASQATRTVAIGLPGDPGYWLVPVGSVSLEFSPSYEVSVSYELDRSIPAGPLKVWVAGIDKDGHVGAPRALDLNVVEDVPSAPLVVSLTWTHDVDLDLLIVQPDGNVLTNKPTAVSGTGSIQGTIDLDSNSSCVIDGHRTENAAYTAASAGLYKVYVKQAGSCGLPYTGWTVRVLRDGTEISRAAGAAYAYETDLPNGGPEGTGRFALSFNIGG
ncbi:MAG TPA: hypothetical protein VI299_23740 [Polyangiales bacterium]